MPEPVADRLFAAELGHDLRHLTGDLGRSGVVTGTLPAEGRDGEVRLLAPDGRERFLGAPALERCADLGGDRAIPSRVGVGDRLPLRLPLEQLTRELADGRDAHVPGADARGLDAIREVVLDERGQSGRRLTSIAHDRAQRREVERARERAGRAEDPLRSLVEAAVGPLQAGAQTSVTGRPWTGGVERVEREIVDQELVHGDDAERSSSGRGELDRQRQPSQTRHDPARSFDVMRSRVRYIRSLEHQLHTRRRLETFGAGGRERTEAKHRLAGHAERTPAGHDESQPGALVDQREDIGRRVGEVLEVVDDEQRRSGGQAMEEALVA